MNLVGRLELVKNGYCSNFTLILQKLRHLLYPALHHASFDIAALLVWIDHLLVYRGDSSLFLHIGIEMISPWMAKQLNH